MKSEPLGLLSRSVLSSGSKSLPWVCSFILGFGTTLFLQSRVPYFFGSDSFFHAKFSSLMSVSPFLDLGTCLPSSVFHLYPVNHHFLFNFLLIPFVQGEIVSGTKLFVAISAGLLFSCFYGLCRRFDYPLLVTVMLLVTSPIFLYRLQMVRVQSLALVFVFLVCGALLDKRRILLFAVSFLWPWLGLVSSVMLFPLLVAYAVSERHLIQQWPIRIVLVSICGWLAGNVLYPFFPNNWTFLWFYFKAKFTLDVPLGVEWRAWSTWQLFVQNYPVCLLLGTVMCFRLLSPRFISKRRRLATGEAFFFVALVFYGFLVLKSARFLEFVVPVALLYAAAACKASGLVAFLKRKRRAESVVLLAVLLLASSATTFRAVSSSRYGEIRDPAMYAGAGNWLRVNTAAGELVVNLRWDDFPLLFFGNSHNSYLAGLDTSYLFGYSAQEFSVWSELSSPSSSGLPSGGLPHGARFAVARTDDPSLPRLRGLLREVYKDGNATVLEFPQLRE